MAIHDDALDLLKYVQIDILSEQACAQYINKIYHNRLKGDSAHDIIDFNRFFYCKQVLKEDPHMQNLIAEIEEELADNYRKKQTILNKFYTRHHNTWDEEPENIRFRDPSNNEVANEVYSRGIQRDQCK